MWRIPPRLPAGPLNYIGYIEGHDVFTGQADVVVCDGFVGNIALKTGEGVATLIRNHLLQAFGQTLWRRCLALMMAPCCAVSTGVLIRCSITVPVFSDCRVLS